MGINACETAADLVCAQYTKENIDRRTGLYIQILHV